MKRAHSPLFALGGGRGRNAGRAGNHPGERRLASALPDEAASNGPDGERSAADFDLALTAEVEACFF